MSQLIKKLQSSGILAIHYLLKMLPRQMAYSNRQNLDMPSKAEAEVQRKKYI